MKTYIIILIFIGIILINGCLEEYNGEYIPKDTREITPKPTVITISIYIDPLPYGVDKNYKNTIREAISFWEKESNIVFKEVYSPSKADVYVKWVKEFGGETIGHTVYGNFIEIGIGDSLCLKKWKPYTYETVLLIAAHELGHVIGYKDDYTNTDLIMYYELSTKYELEIDETDTLSDGWTSWYRVCTKRSTTSYYFEVTSTEPLDIYVMPSIQDYELYINGQTYNYYSECQNNQVNIFKKTCDVNMGSIIILHNPTILGIGETAQYNIKAKER